MLRRALDLVTSHAASGARLGAGLFVGALGPRPEHPFELYDFEPCPHSRRVREALSILDLDAMIYPCPRRGTRFRPTLAARGGRTLIPYLVDPNHDQALYESQVIVDYLFEHYGRGSTPLHLRGRTAVTVSSQIASALALPRGLPGLFARPSRAPARPLELWSFEASPYCRLVRESLSRLELPYLLHNVAKGSPRRPAFVARSGRMMVPFLVDPNTGRELFESADIVRYLDSTYATGG
jgi:glutathione S-transferase